MPSASMRAVLEAEVEVLRGPSSGPGNRPRSRKAKSLIKSAGSSKSVRMQTRQPSVGSKTVPSRRTRSKGGKLALFGMKQDFLGEIIGRGGWRLTWRLQKAEEAQGRDAQGDVFASEEILLSRRPDPSPCRACPGGPTTCRRVFPELPDDVDRASGADGDRDAIAGAGVEFDDLAFHDLVLGLEDQAGVVDFLVHGDDHHPADLGAEGLEVSR